MNKKMLIVFVSGLLLLVMTGLSGAATIDFEDLVFADGNVSVSGVVASGGFDFEVGPVSSATTLPNLYVGHLSHWADNGSINLATYYDVSFYATNGSLFSISSVDLGEYSASVMAINAVGYYDDGSTISQSFTLDGVFDAQGDFADFQTFLFGKGWTELSSIYMSSVSTWFLDNVVVNEPAPVPEPSTMFLLGSGLFGVVALRKKVKKN